MEQQLQQERIVIENDDEIEIDLKDLVLEILSFWKWVLFALIIGAVTAYCISRFVMVPQYEVNIPVLCIVQKHVDYKSCGYTDRYKSDKRLYGYRRGASRA